MHEPNTCNSFVEFRDILGYCSGDIYARISNLKCTIKLYLNHRPLVFSNGREIEDSLNVVCTAVDQEIIASYLLLNQQTTHELLSITINNKIIYFISK